MKKNIGFLVALLVISMLITACGGSSEASAPEAQESTMDGEAPVAEVSSEDPYSVYFITAQTGDKSFTDSCVEGLNRADENIENVEVQVIEAGTEVEKQYAAMEDILANEDDVDMVITIGNPFPNTDEMAVAYPEVAFVIGDQTFDFEACPECKANVYNVGYAQNEGSYLAGYYAALMSDTKKVGAVGGDEMAVILDFFTGYKQGAVDAGIAKEDILFSFAGEWYNPAKGKELALAMYDQGADVVFQVASGTGYGVLEAAWEADKWAIGVDSDQGLIVAETNQEMAEHIPTSMLKEVGNSMYRAIELAIAGELPFGTKEVLGIADGGVGLARNELYEELTPDDIKAKMDELIESVTNGDIDIYSYFSDEGKAFYED